jgi:hypothetical protein
VRRTASEKVEIVRLVEGTDLPVRAMLRQLGVPRSTFYGWYPRNKRIAWSCQSALRSVFVSSVVGWQASNPMISTPAFWSGLTSRGIF